MRRAAPSRSRCSPKTPATALPPKTRSAASPAPSTMPGARRLPGREILGLIHRRGGQDMAEEKEYEVIDKRGIRPEGGASSDTPAEEAPESAAGAAGGGITEEELRAAMEEAAEAVRSEEHTSELQSPDHLVCRLL